MIKMWAITFAVMCFLTLVNSHAYKSNYKIPARRARQKPMNSRPSVYYYQQKAAAHDYSSYEAPLTIYSSTPVASYQSNSYQKPKPYSY